MERGERDVLRRGEHKMESSRAPERSLSPFGQMDRLFDEVFKRPFYSLLSQTRGESEPFLPVDIFEDNESVFVKAELPGIKREDIDVQLTSDSITISGKKSSEEKIERKDFFRLERSYGSFSRRCQLPAEIETDKARASYKDGVLEVRMPKSHAEAGRVKKLTIE